MQTVLLDKKRHNRKKFDCGVSVLNDFLRLMANQQSQRDNSRTYVLEDTNNPEKIAGFYTLSMVNISLEKLPESLQKKHPLQTSSGLIARLAVDKAYQGRGLGSWLLAEALYKLLDASEAVGFPLVVVDAKEGKVSFYESFGFTRFKHEKDRLFITVADIRANTINKEKK